MQLSEAKTLARGYVRAAKKNLISDAVLETIIYQGIKDVARKTKCLPKEEKFAVAADTRSYNLSEKLTRYLLPDKDNLWWQNGSKWQEIFLRTREWMNKNQPNWRDSSSGNPQYYSIEGDNLSTYPKASTSLADGFRFYFFQAPQQPTLSTHYLFGYSAEIERLMILDEAVLLYWKVRAFKILGKGEDIVIAAGQEYKAEVDEKTKLLSERPDISANRRTKYQGRTIR